MICSRGSARGKLEPSLDEKHLSGEGWQKRDRKGSSERPKQPAAQSRHFFHHKPQDSAAGKENTILFDQLRHSFKLGHWLNRLIAVFASGMDFDTRMWATEFILYDVFAVGPNFAQASRECKHYNLLSRAVLKPMIGPVGTYSWYLHTVIGKVSGSVVLLCSDNFAQPSTAQSKTLIAAYGGSFLPMATLFDPPTSIIVTSKAGRQP